jgi:uncharacterized protein (TIGR02147 family)
VRSNIFHYTNHTEYLLRLKESENLAGKKITYEELAKYAGLNSRTKIKKMLKGELKIPKKVLSSLSEYFNLNNEEKKYLDLLRVFNDATDTEMSVAFYEKILSIRKKNLPNIQTSELNQKQLRLLEEWYYLPLLSFIGLEKSSADIFIILKAFRGQLTSEQISKGIRTLIEINLLKYTPEGTLVKVNESVSLLDGLPRALVKKFHQMMIQKAQDSIYGIPEDKRQLLSATLTVKEAMVPEIKDRIEKFITKLHNDYAVKDADSLYQINTQLFNLARI